MAHNGRFGALGEVDAAKAGEAGGGAFAAVRERVHVPQIGEDAAAAEGKAAIKGGFKGAERRGREVTGGGEGFHGAVPRARGNDGAAFDAGVECETHGSDRPIKALVVGHERRADEDEGAHGDFAAGQVGDGALEISEGHAFVEAGEDFGVGGFEADGDLQVALEQVAEFPSAPADQGGVGFDDHGIEVGDEVGDGGVVGGRDRVGIEEIAAVVELDVARKGQAIERPADLGGHGPDGDGVVRGVFPQVAHQAAEGAFAVGDEDGRDVVDPAGGDEFLFVQEGVGAEGIDRVFGRSAMKDPCVGKDGRTVIDKGHETISAVRPPGW